MKKYISAAKLNKNEQKFIEKLKLADSYVPSDWELELDYSYPDEAWIAMRYNEDRGEAIPLSEFSKYPIIYDDEAEKKGIDVEKCLDFYGCAYVGK